MARFFIKPDCCDINVLKGKTAQDIGFDDAPKGQSLPCAGM